MSALYRPHLYLKIICESALVQILSRISEQTAEFVYKWQHTEPVDLHASATSAVMSCVFNCSTADAGWIHCILIYAAL